jgi:hypothetical protein
MLVQLLKQEELSLRKDPASMVVQQLVCQESDGSERSVLLAGG